MNRTATAKETENPGAVVEVFRGGVALLDRYAREWGVLCDSSTYDEPFYRPEWVRAYAAAFASEREFVLATVRAAGRLVAILPLVSELGTIGGLPARKLRSAGNTHTVRYDLVHDRAFGNDVIPSLWKALLRESGWDVLELENVPEGGALTELVRHAAAEGYCTSASPGLSPPYLDLTGCEGRFERLLERLDTKFRANLRRRKRKLEARGALALVASHTADSRLEQFYALERAGWKGTEHSAISSDASTRAFYDAVARNGEQHGYFSLYALELDGRPIAMYFGLYHRARYYLLKTAYDESLRDCSPGQLLTSEALRDLVADGCTEFDFLGGVMDWKRDWAPSLRHLTDLHVFRGPAGRALHAVHFRARPAVARAVRKVRAAW